MSELPPYAYIPGHRPHPTRDPEGHSYGHPEPSGVLDPAAPRTCPAFLKGIELFNAGYYWEAHEYWEALWHAAGRAGSVAALLQALIKLAASAIKVRQGVPSAAQSLARAAARQLRDSGTASCGLEREAVARMADALPGATGDPSRPVEVVHEGALWLT